MIDYILCFCFFSQHPTVMFIIWTGLVPRFDPNILTMSSMNYVCPDGGVCHLKHERCKITAKQNLQMPSLQTDLCKGPWVKSPRSPWRPVTRHVCARAGEWGGWRNGQDVSALRKSSQYSRPKSESQQDLLRKRRGINIWALINHGAKQLLCEPKPAFKWGL